MLTVRGHEGRDMWANTLPREARSRAATSTEGSPERPDWGESAVRRRAPYLARARNFLDALILRTATVKCLQQCIAHRTTERKATDMLDEHIQYNHMHQWRLRGPNQVNAPQCSLARVRSALLVSVAESTRDRQGLRRWKDTAPDVHLLLVLPESQLLRILHRKPRGQRLRVCNEDDVPNALVPNLTVRKFSQTF